MPWHGSGIPPSYHVTAAARERDPQSDGKEMGSCDRGHRAVFTEFVHSRFMTSVDNGIYPDGATVVFLAVSLAAA